MKRFILFLLAIMCLAGCASALINQINPISNSHNSADLALTLRGSKGEGIYPHGTGGEIASTMHGRLRFAFSITR